VHVTPSSVAPSPGSSGAGTDVQAPPESVSIEGTPSVSTTATQLVDDVHETAFADGFDGAVELQGRDVALQAGGGAPVRLVAPAIVVDVRHSTVQAPTATARRTRVRGPLP
jgi:hypothetical protein